MIDAARLIGNIQHIVETVDRGCSRQVDHIFRAGALTEPRDPVGAVAVCKHEQIVAATAVQ